MLFKDTKQLVLQNSSETRSLLGSGYQAFSRTLEQTCFLNPGTRSTDAAARRPRFCCWSLGSSDGLSAQTGNQNAFARECNSLITHTQIKTPPIGRGGGPTHTSTHIYFTLFTPIQDSVTQLQCWGKHECFSDVLKSWTGHTGITKPQLSDSLLDSKLLVFCRGDKKQMTCLFFTNHAAKRDKRFLIRF